MSKSSQIRRFRKHDLALKRIFLAVKRIFLAVKRIFLAAKRIFTFFQIAFYC